MSVRPCVCPSVRPVPSHKKVTETENFTEQSCQMYFKGDKNTFRVTLMPLQCWARQSHTAFCDMHPVILPSFIMVIDPDVELDCHPWGEAWLCILNFKSTRSEFQKPCQTTVMRGEAELRIYNLKKTSPSQTRSKRPNKIGSEEIQGMCILIKILWFFFLGPMKVLHITQYTKSPFKYVAL